MENTDRQWETKLSFESLARVHKAEGMDPDTFIARAKDDWHFPPSEKYARQLLKEFQAEAKKMAATPGLRR